MLLISDLLLKTDILSSHGMSSDIRIRFGIRLRTLRRKHGLTQVILAEKFGLDRSYVADVERGKRNISLLNIEIIAKGFGLSLAQLFSRL